MNEYKMAVIICECLLFSKTITVACIDKKYANKEYKIAKSLCEKYCKKYIIKTDNNSIYFKNKSIIQFKYPKGVE